jgi:hypothetical protein
MSGSLVSSLQREVRVEPVLAISFPYFSFILGEKVMAEKSGNSSGACPLTLGEQIGIAISDDDIEELRSKGRKCLLGRLG